MTYDDLPLILLLAGLLVASGLCSGTETALFRLSHADRHSLRKSRPVASRAVEVLLAKPRGTLVTVLMLNMTVNVLYFVGSSMLSLRMESALAVAVTGIVTLMAVILIGEVLAKVLAGAMRVRVAAVVAPPLLVVHRALTPVRRVIDGGMVAPLARLVRPEEQPVRLSIDELSTLIEQGVRSGAIVADEERLLAEVVSLRDRRVREILTPRVEMVWAERDAPPERIIELVRRTGRTSLPLVEGTLDGTVVGMLDARAFLASVELSRSRGERSTPRPDRFTVPAVFVPENVRLDRLLERFRETGSSHAIVVDERGTISGFVEIEDVIDAMSMTSPDADADHETEVQLVGLGVWSVSADLSVRTWMQYFPAAEFGQRELLGRVATLGGLVLARFGHIPKPGEVTHLGNVRLEVESVVGRRIDRVRVSLEEGAP